MGVWESYNPNPAGRSVGDCAVRAVAKALDISWEKALALIAANAFEMADMPSSNSVWGSVPIVNDCIRQIAALYPANVMGVTNFDDGTLFGETHADLHDGSATNPHFNEGGYFFVASKWLGEIRRLIRENIDKF